MFSMTSATKSSGHILSTTYIFHRLQVNCIYRMNNSSNKVLSWWSCCT